MAIEKTFVEERKTGKHLSEILDTWHKVPVPLPTYYDHYNDMLVWCLENSQGKFYTSNGQIIYFQLEKDATVFALKWGSK